MVKGDQVVAMSLRLNYHITLGLESKGPTEISVGQQGLNFCRNGSDGNSLHAGCFVWSPRNSVYHVVIRQLVHGVQR